MYFLTCFYTVTQDYIIIFYLFFIHRQKMQTVKDKLGDVKQAASNHVEDAKIGVKNKIEDVEDTVANKKDDSKGAVSDNMKKYYNTNKFFFLLRILFIIANFAEVLLGILVFIFALIGLLISP